MTDKQSFTVAEARALLARQPAPKISPDLVRELQPGWLLPYLVGVDAMSWRRWDHWTKVMLDGRLTDRPIPQIEWIHNSRHDGAVARKHLEQCLDLIDGNGWAGWSSWTNLTYFFDWLLFGFGHSSVPKEPKEPRPGVSMKLYQLFNIAYPMLYPYDYWGDIMAEVAIGRSAGFYPTPQDVCEMMTRMNFDAGADNRRKSTMDPAMGTARMLLHASNYTYLLYGMDILEICAKASLVNGYLYAPWMVKPFPFVVSEKESEKPAGEQIIDAVATEAQPEPLELPAPAVDEVDEDELQNQELARMAEVARLRDLEEPEQATLFELPPLAYGPKITNPTTKPTPRRPAVADDPDAVGELLDVNVL